MVGDEQDLVARLVCCSRTEEDNGQVQAICQLHGGCLQIQVQTHEEPFVKYNYLYIKIAHLTKTPQYLMVFLTLRPPEMLQLDTTCLCRKRRTKGRNQ